MTEHIYAQYACMNVWVMCITDTHTRHLFFFPLLLPSLWVYINRAMHDALQKAHAQCTAERAFFFYCTCLFYVYCPLETLNTRSKVFRLVSNKLTRKKQRLQQKLKNRALLVFKTKYKNRDITGYMKFQFVLKWRIRSCLKVKCCPLLANA